MVQTPCSTDLIVALLATELLVLTVILSGLGGGTAATAVVCTTSGAAGFLAKCANSCILLLTNLA